jgi:hypothetical protein
VQQTCGGAAVGQGVRVAHFGRLVAHESAPEPAKGRFRPLSSKDAKLSTTCTIRWIYMDQERRSHIRNHDDKSSCGILASTQLVK